MVNTVTLWYPIVVASYILKFLIMLYSECRVGLTSRLHISGTALFWSFNQHGHFIFFLNCAFLVKLCIAFWIVLDVDWRISKQTNKRVQASWRKFNKREGGTAAERHYALMLRHGRPHIGANGVSWPPPWKKGWKIKKQKHARTEQF